MSKLKIVGFFSLLTVACGIGGYLLMTIKKDNRKSVYFVEKHKAEKEES